MPTDTVLALFAIAIPFALFAGALAWAQSRTGVTDNTVVGWSFAMGEAPDSPSSQSPPACPACGKAMTFARAVPRLGPLPELRSFHCLTCREVSTVPDRRVGLGKPAERR